MKHNGVLRWLSSQGLALTGLGLAQIVVRSQVQFPQRRPHRLGVQGSTPQRAQYRAVPTTYSVASLSPPSRNFADHCTRLMDIRGGRHPIYIRTSQKRCRRIRCQRA
jgi:hypothetical protein